MKTKKVIVESDDKEIIKDIEDDKLDSKSYNLIKKALKKNNGIKELSKNSNNIDIKEIHV